MARGQVPAAYVPGCTASTLARLSSAGLSVPNVVLFVRDVSLKWCRAV